MIIVITTIRKPKELLKSRKTDETDYSNRIRRHTFDINRSGTESMTPSEFYLPLYAKLSDKSVKAICEEYSRRRKKKRHKWSRTKTSSDNYSGKRHSRHRGCGLIKSISQPNVLARRLNKVGGIVRHGTRWFQTEYSLGYNFFEYRNLTELRHAHPFAVHPLDAARFDGTDNTACGEDTFVYYTAAAISRIYSYKISEKHSKSVTIGALKTPIYQFSNSYVDLESDGVQLWIMYHSASNANLQVSVRDCSTLVERKSWFLQLLNTENIVNAFIVCDHLYIVSQNSTSNILNMAYDFNTGKYFEEYPEIGSWKRYGIPSSVQYDHLSKTINIFDDGIIYNISVKI